MASDDEGGAQEPGDHYAQAWARALRDRSTDPAECGPGEVDFTITWRIVSDEVLRGIVRARNICDRVWRLTGKPTVVRVGTDGRAFPEHHVITLEGRFRDWILVRPGELVDALVSISGWDGTDQADYVMIRWPGGVKAALVQGPTHPAVVTTYPATTSSSWFARPNLSLAAPQPELDIDGQRGPASDADAQRASLQTPRDPRAAAGDGHASSSNDELADFVAARLDALDKALHQLHRVRCGTPPTAFALDQDGHRYAVPPCLCDTDIRRSQRLVEAQQDVVRMARDGDAPFGHRILQALADAYADHPDYPPA